MKIRNRRKLSRVAPLHRTMLALVSTLALVTASSGASAQSLDDVLIQVNQRTVTQRDLLQRLELRLRTLEQANLPPERLEAKRSEARLETLRDLYEEAIILARADEIGYQATAEQVDQEVVEIISSQDFQQRIESETPGDRDRIAALVHDDVVKRLTVQEVFRREIETRVDIGSDDARKYYDENQDEFLRPGKVRATAIVVKESADRTAEEIAKIAGDIRKAIDSGRAISEAAGPYIDVGIASNPVDLGWIEQGQVEPTLESALWTAEVGQAIDPFPAQGGVHVVQVAERTPPDAIPFEKVQPALTSRLHYAAFSRALADYMLELETRYEIRTTSDGISPQKEAAVEPLQVTPDAAIAPTPDPRASQVASAVTSWAAAWSAQDVDAYLASYGSGFSPPNGLSRNAWETRRRDRLSRPQFIRVEISELQTDAQGDRATATFRQSYSSDRFSDVVGKALAFAWQDGRWKIVSEQSQ